MEICLKETKDYKVIYEYNVTYNSWNDIPSMTTREDMREMARKNNMNRDIVFRLPSY